MSRPSLFPASLPPSRVFSSCSAVWSKHAGKHEVSTAPRSEATFPETFLDKTETQSANRHMKWSRKYADGEFALRSFLFFFKILLNVYLYIWMCNGCPYAGLQEYKPSAVIVSFFFFFENVTHVFSMCFLPMTRMISWCCVLVIKSVSRLSTHLKNRNETTHFSFKSSFLLHITFWIHFGPIVDLIWFEKVTFSKAVSQWMWI